MQCRQCKCGAPATEAWINLRFTFCSASCALQWALNLPLDNPAWSKVKIGGGITVAEPFLYANTSDAMLRE